MTTPSQTRNSKEKPPDLRPLRFTVIHGNHISRSQNALPATDLRIPVKRRHVGAGPEG